MVKVNVVSKGLGNYKSRSLVLPLIRYSEQLERAGIHYDIHHNLNSHVRKADIVIIEDKVLTDKQSLDPRKQVERLSNSVNQVLWFDTSDSTGTIFSDILPLVDGYYKKQLLSDTEHYLQPLYGTRLYTDYYHEKFGIEDRVEENLVQVRSKSDLEKLGVFWNLSQNFYLPFMGNVITKMIEEMLGISPSTLDYFVPWETVFNCSWFWEPIRKDRAVDISGRFGTSYDKNTIEYHRNLMKQNIPGNVDTSKLNTVRYWQELRRSKVVLSPFGWGEICHRDFEGFLSGCIVVKPRMDHLETWPPLYESNETVLTVNWDMSDLEQTVNEALDNYEEKKHIAQEGQSRYREFLIGDSAANKFVDHFTNLLSSHSSRLQ